MKIGIFDSGLGGLIIAHSLIKSLPEYDYVYLGDTARVPYGNRSQAIIYDFTEVAVNYLFTQGCQIVILACNTASAEALRKIQQNYLPVHFPNQRVLGVLIPAVEQAVSQTRNNRVGVIATQGTVNSNAYPHEIQKLRADTQVFQQAAPLLVPLAENNSLQYASPILDDYLAPLLREKIDTLVLGCTHYPLFKEQIQSKLNNVQIISQDEIIPKKLREYLQRHPDIEQKLSHGGTSKFLMTDIAPSTLDVARLLFEQPIHLHKVAL